MTKATVIGLVVRGGVDEALPYAIQVLAWAIARGFTALIDEASYSVVHESLAALGATLPLKTVSPHELVVQADPIVSLGGDGTLIGVARLVHGAAPAMVGVNFGKLGFLTEISPDELLPVLDGVIDGSAIIGERAMLAVSVRRLSGETAEHHAVNEIGVIKGIKSSLPNLEVEFGKEMVMAFRGDGILIATPTGSTAYSLSAGGAIVHPDLDAVLATPLCPHSLTVRPIVLPTSEVLTIRLRNYQEEIYAVIDGHMLIPIEVGDSIAVKRSQHAVRFVRSPSRSYFAILREKLNWGLGNKERPSVLE